MTQCSIEFRFRFQTGAVVPQVINTPEYFDKVWHLEINVRALGFPREEVGDIMQGWYRSMPRFYPAIVPDTVTPQQRCFIPSSDKNVIFVNSPAIAEAERGHLTKFTCKQL